MGQTARTIAFHTLGCKLNYSETSALGRMMEAEGFLQKNFSENADVYVINTCSVTENADKECRQLVRRIQRKNPEAFVVITGCYAQLKPEEIASIEGVDLVLGASEKFNLASHIKELSKGDSARISSCDIDHIEGFHSAYSLTGRTRTFLKVQDGCDYNCTFCTIPLARGHSRSDTIERVKENVKHLAGQGVKEIVLTGINLGDFGKGFEGGKRSTESFLDLLYALDKESDIKRYRISSIEPNLLSSEIISLVAASEKFMPHFHIPLQSGSDRILGLMRRRYRRQLYAEKVAEIRSLMPDACIGVDVITGFPSESEEDFQETLSFLQNIDISYLHVFTYSERANTPALDIKPVVPQSVRQERTRILRQFSYQTMQQFEVRHKGQTRKVLFESVNKNGMMEGYTDNYIRVQTPYRKEWENEIIDWVLG